MKLNKIDVNILRVCSALRKEGVQETNKPNIPLREIIENIKKCNVNWIF